MQRTGFVISIAHLKPDQTSCSTGLFLKFFIIYFNGAENQRNQQGNRNGFILKAVQTSVHQLLKREGC